MKSTRELSQFSLVLWSQGTATDIAESIILGGYLGTLSTPKEIIKFWGKNGKYWWPLCDAFPEPTDQRWGWTAQRGGITTPSLFIFRLDLGPSSFLIEVQVKEHNTYQKLCCFRVLLNPIVQGGFSPNLTHLTPPPGYVLLPFRYPCPLLILCKYS